MNLLIVIMTKFLIIKAKSKNISGGKCPFFFIGNSKQKPLMLHKCPAFEVQIGLMKLL